LPLKDNGYVPFQCGYVRARNVIYLSPHTAKEKRFAADTLGPLPLAPLNPSIVPCPHTSIAHTSNMNSPHSKRKHYPTTRSTTHKSHIKASSPAEKGSSDIEEIEEESTKGMVVVGLPLDWLEDMAIVEDLVAALPPAQTVKESSHPIATQDPPVSNPTASALALPLVDATHKVSCVTQKAE
jgi:hypothetical protein